MSETNDTNHTENAKMELAKTLLAVRAIASEEDYLRVRAILAKPDDEGRVDQAIHGLSKEDEFALMCRLMGTATHMVHLEQRPVIRGDYLVPDFLARFQPGCYIAGKTADDSDGFRCFVEVKSTTKDKYRIGGSRLRRLRRYADDFGFPLLLAVRFLRFEDYSLWVMVEDVDRSATSITVSYGDLASGMRHVLWDEHLYLLRPGVRFECVYDASPHSETDHRDSHGYFQELHIILDGKHLPVPGIDGLTLLAFFEAFGLHEVDVQKEGTTTRAILAPQMAMCFIADMLYSFNRLVHDARGQVMFDPTRILAGSSTPTLIDREFIDWIAHSLFPSGTLLVLGIGEPDAQVRMWHAHGGRE